MIARLDHTAVAGAGEDEDVGQHVQDQLCGLRIQTGIAEHPAELCKGAALLKDGRHSGRRGLEGVEALQGRKDRVRRLRFIAAGSVCMERQCLRHNRSVALMSIILKR